jgi:ribonuclease HI
MTPDPHAIHIYTDGSCFGNPGGQSGCAARVEYPERMQREEGQIVDFGCAESTNNRMELMACTRALKWIRENEPWDGVQRVQVFTDSQYVKDGTFLAAGWKKNGWRNHHGEPKENSDLWNEFLAARRQVRVRTDFVRVPGKSSPVLNRVDADAKRAARRGGIGADHGYRRWKVGRSRVAKGSATAFPARGQSAVIFIYRKDSPIRGENKLRFNVFLEETQTYSGKFYALTSDVQAQDLHLQHGYRVRFGDNPRNPRIAEIVEEMSLPKPELNAPDPPYAKSG